jgi:hypothetical protein
VGGSLDRHAIGDAKKTVMSEQDKSSAAVAEVAKQALIIADKAGPFLRKAFGSLVEDGVGIVADRLKYYRLAQFYSLIEKTDAILVARDVKITRVVPPAFALPLMESATIEDDESLHDLWANLLATAMDPEMPQIKRSFIGIVREFEPQDAQILKLIWNRAYERVRNESSIYDDPFLQLHLDAVQLSNEVDLTVREVQTSLLNLDRLGCIRLLMTQSLAHFAADMRKEVRAVVELTVIGDSLIVACGQ